MYTKHCSNFSQCSSVDALFSEQTLAQYTIYSDISAVHNVYYSDISAVHNVY